MPRDLAAPSDGAEDFETFYEREYLAGVRLAAALTGRWDVAEELVQDSFLALHRRWATISSYDMPAAWLRRVILNRALSTLRRRAVEARLVTRLTRQPHVDVALPEPDGELWRLVAALPRRQAEVVALSYVEDRSVSDVAAILGCEENTVRTHLRRARLHLARDLKLEQEESEA